MSEQTENDPPKQNPSIDAGQCAHCAHVEDQATAKPKSFTQGSVWWTIAFAALGLGSAVVIGASVQDDADRLGTLTVTGITIAFLAALLRAVSHQRKEVSDLRADHFGKQLAITALAFAFLVAVAQLDEYFNLTVQPIIGGIAIFVIVVALIVIGVIRIPPALRSRRSKRYGSAKL